MRIELKPLIEKPVSAEFSHERIVKNVKSVAHTSTIHCHVKRADG